MLVRDSKKHQPEFDIGEARRVYTEGGWADEPEAGFITSPYDLFAVETLRDRWNSRVRQSVPTDVFVFGKGQPPRPDCTHIGGDPFWPVGREWPTDASRKPYLFFGQINFADSKDLVGDLPGDLLLMFIGHEPDWYWMPMVLRLEWVNLGSRVQTEFDRSLIASTGGPFFGAIYRTADYPDFSEDPEDSYVSVLNGTKIGGVPWFANAGEEVSGQFLCQLCSIQAAARVPYPWLNVAEPLRLTSHDEGSAGLIHDEDNELVFADMESIYFYRDTNEQIRSSFGWY
jgi:hypothetical protein